MIDNDTQALPAVAYRVDPKESRILLVSFHSTFSPTTGTADDYEVHAIISGATLHANDLSIFICLRTIQRCHELTGKSVSV